MKRMAVTGLLVFVVALGTHVRADSQPPTKAVSPEGSAYLKRLQKGTPFGANEFSLEKLRAGMGSRRAPASKDIKLIRVKIGDIPGEWVVAPGADPEVRLLYIHGGGFVSGSGGFYLTMAAHISTAAKCAVLLPDYRLAPEHRFPAGLDDRVSAHERMREQRPARRGATFIAGDSAGGSLTGDAAGMPSQETAAAGDPLSATTDLTSRASRQDRAGSIISRECLCSMITIWARLIRAIRLFHRSLALLRNSRC